MSKQRVIKKIEQLESQSPNLKIVVAVHELTKAQPYYSVDGVHYSDEEFAAFKAKLGPQVELYILEVKPNVWRWKSKDEKRGE